MCVWGVYPTCIHSLASSLALPKCSINGLLYSLKIIGILCYPLDLNHTTLFCYPHYSTFFLWIWWNDLNHGIFSMSIYYFCIYITS